MPDHSRDYDDTTRWPQEWWNSLEGEGPKPYATASWTYFQEVIEAEEADD